MKNIRTIIPNKLNVKIDGKTLLVEAVVRYNFTIVDAIPYLYNDKNKMIERFDIMDNNEIEFWEMLLSTPAIESEYHMTPGVWDVYIDQIYDYKRREVSYRLQINIPELTNSDISAYEQLHDVVKLINNEYSKITADDDRDEFSGQLFGHWSYNLDIDIRKRLLTFTNTGT